ncbi:MAG TPA: TIGR00282 family metallophosphoesterase [Candidatus Magasanikbacteria bacterium]|nr:TIGR00282 family metallophosphoesterase [Candidatus Magasanikbacteria bacterium]
MFKVLIFGDIVGKTGRQAVAKILPGLKKQFHPNLIIANVENLAHGTGATPKTLTLLEEAGVKVFTGGDHIFAKPDVTKIFDREDSPLIRPANLSIPLGQGEKMLTVAQKRVLVINLLGRVFLGDKLSEQGIAITNPFTVVDEIIKKYEKQKPQIVIVDFHTEATSEQVAMGYHLDGRASVLFGTHTHIPTADAQILDKGLGYITDVGMSGAKDTVLGVDKKIILNRFLEGEKLSFDWPELKEATVNALYVEISEKSGQAKKIKLIQKTIKI